jgi:hypothetical protein
VEDLLAERGVFVSREVVRLWINRFGGHFADCIRRDRPTPNDKWIPESLAAGELGPKGRLTKAASDEWAVSVKIVLIRPRKRMTAIAEAFWELV